jgi:hypothetical protein
MVGLLAGISGTLITVVLLTLAYKGYKAGWPTVKSSLIRAWYRTWWKVVARTCITCNGAGEYPFGGGVEGSAGMVAGTVLMWECGFCEGTGKEHPIYTYRFKFLAGKKTLAEFERDQQKAEKVLGPPDNWMKTAKTTSVTGGGSDDRG